MPRHMSLTARAVGSHLSSACRDTDDVLVLNKVDSSDSSDLNYEGDESRDVPLNLSVATD